MSIELPWNHGACGYLSTGLNSFRLSCVEKNGWTNPALLYNISLSPTTCSQTGWNEAFSIYRILAWRTQILLCRTEKRELHPPLSLNYYPTTLYWVLMERLSPWLLPGYISPSDCVVWKRETQIQISLRTWLSNVVHWASFHRKRTILKQKTDYNCENVLSTGRVVRREQLVGCKYYPRLSRHNTCRTPQNNLCLKLRHLVGEYIPALPLVFICTCRCSISSRTSNKRSGKSSEFRQ